MKSVYTGDEKVAEFESYDELRVGDGKPAFIYEGNALVYPNPVKDGLVLWYDFSGRTNTDGQRGIAEDLSGNGNHGTLQNFNFTPESGYDKNKLLFDGVDDYIATVPPASTNLTWSVTFTPTFKGEDSFLMSSQQSAFYLKLDLNGRVAVSARGVDSPIDYVSVIETETGKTYTIDFVHKDGEYRVYANSQLVGKSAKSMLGQVYGLRNIGRYTAASPRNFLGEIHSVKVYDKVLTAEEIAHNYAIEKERFGIE